MFKIVDRNSISGKMKTLLFSLLFGVFFTTSCIQKQIVEIPREPAAAKGTVNRLSFERCTASSRNYLQDAMTAMPTEYFQSHESDWTDKIPMRCVQVAQRNFSGHFAACANSNARPTTTALKPCMDEQYVTLTYNAYHDVMDCFNLNPKDFYLQIMIESGFHVNAINKTGFDSGITQFTANGIKRVMANNLVDRTRRVLLESSRPSCQRISSIVGHFNVDSFAVKNRCSMISLPENPYRAMVFNYLHTMLDQISIEEIVDELVEIKPIMTDKIKRHLVYLAYNRGLTGVKRLLRGYIQSRKNVEHEIVSEDFELDKNLSDVKGILRLSPTKRQKLILAPKIKNLSFAEYAVINKATYVSDMADASEYTKKILGDECGGL